MKVKGKAKDAAVKSKAAVKSAKDAGKAGAAAARHDVVFELPLRVRAASREEAHLLALRWLTDALLKTERPATIRVSPPRQMGKGTAAEAASPALAVSPPPGDDSPTIPYGPDAAEASPPASAPVDPTETAAKKVGARASRERRRDSAAGNGVA